MSSPPPTKPPRGVKQGKETSGLLMSVIRTLSASETNEQREKERAKLEKEYKKSDARLDELVAAHAQEIMDVMQKFSAVGAALSVWGQHCDAATARLAACRGLLRLRRDDLKRLWTTARTHHYALQMLTDIERVVVSEREAREYISAGRVLACAHTLTAALATADTALAHVDALHATRLHLQARKRQVVEATVRRVSEAVYRGEPLRTRRRAAAVLLAELTKSEEVTDAYLQDITPEFEASLAEEDKTFETTVMISLEALGVLEQLKEATEKFKVQIQNELLEVIECVSRRIIEEGDVVDVECEEDDDMPDDAGASETGRPLAKLFTILTQEFKAIAARNKRLLQLWRASLQKYKVSDSCLHTEQHYWSAVQQVMQLLLTEYLDIESVPLAVRAAPAPEPVRPLNDYFGKKRLPKRADLFKLQSARCVRAAASRQTGHAAVCAPAHLHAALPALHDLAAHIEPRADGGECSLRAFITDYVRTGETERLSRAARDRIERAARAPSAWRERTDVIVGVGSRRTVFATCAQAWGAVSAAAAAARRLARVGGAHALRAVTAALGTLAAVSRAAHARAGAGAAGRAQRWLADDDIVRFLQALPNWRAAAAPAPAPAPAPAAPAPAHTDRHKDEELMQAYEREAEILGSSLGDGAVTNKEIISDVNTLADIAVLCESMDWLASNVRGIPALVSGPGGLKLTDKFINDIESAALIFDEISHKCLLLLHLELRIECFHYLGQEQEQEQQAEAGGAGGAGGAARLARALLAFHEHVAALLHPHRMHYVMSGIGEMMSAAVVWRCRALGGECSVQVAALRHCLAALQLPHRGLQRATDYLRLLALSPEEIITSVREKGPQFSELEYLNAFKVIGAKRGLSQADMKQHLKLLSAALGHVGVTV